MVDGTNATAVLAVTAVFSVLMTVVLILRFIVRYSQSDFWSLDDWALSIAFFFTWACAGSNFISATNYPPLYTVGPRGQDHDSTSFSRYLLASQICWALAATSAKAALLLFYRRVFIREWVYWATWILLALLGALALTSIVFYAVDSGYKLSGNAGIGAVDSLLGVAVMAIPLAIIWFLSMGLSSKLIETFWYSLGWLAVAFSIARLASFGIADVSLSEQPWSLLLCWSIMDPTLWLIAACVPTIRQLWRHSQQDAEQRRDVLTRFDTPVPATATGSPDNITALPNGGVPSNVLYHPRGRSAQRRSDASRLTQPIELPAYTRPTDIESQNTIRDTPSVTRHNSTRTDTGMYTHWRHDDEDDDDAT